MNAPSADCITETASKQILGLLSQSTLSPIKLERLETELREQARRRPISLVLPALYSEFEGKAMRIVEELSKVKYIGQIVLVLGRAAGVFMENPLGAPLIPNWNRVTSAIPGVLGMLMKAVDGDNK